MKLTFSKAVKKISTILFLSTILFNSISCKMQEDPDSSVTTNDLITLEESSPLIGTWKSQFGEVYKITTSSIENYYTDFTTSELTKYYTGNNVKIYKETENSGYIYFQFDDPNYIGSQSYNQNTNESIPATVDQWYCWYYSNLSDKGVYIYSAAKSDGTQYCFNDLQEAIDNLTVENGFFAFSSECTKDE